MTGLLRLAGDAEARQQQIDEAREMHRQGDLEGAFRVFEGLQKSNPLHAEITYRLGNVQKDRGAISAALDLYNRAIVLKPDYAHAYCNRAVVLAQMGHVRDALDSYGQALKLDPTDSIAHCNRALLCLGAGDKDAALSGFEAAIRHDERNFAALFGYGAILQERRQWSNSLSAYRSAVAVNANDAALQYNLAIVAKESGQLDEALSSCDRAIALIPHFADAFAKRAEVLQELERYSDALQSYDQAVTLAPNNAAHVSNRGVLRQIMGDNDAALTDYRRAAQLDPSSAEAWFNCGAALGELGDLEGATQSYDRALELRPSYEAAFVNRGVALQDQGRVGEAVESYEAAIAINPRQPEAHYNLALASLTLGDYAKGWREYEWRWQAKGGPIYREKREFVEPLWLGEQPLAGKRILIYGEQGLGDSIQFARFIEAVANLRAEVYVEVPFPLAKMFESLPGVSRVIAYGDRIPEIDYQCPFMSLALAFNTSLMTIPSAHGYLTSEPRKLSIWEERLGVKSKPRVGLAWSGNQAAGTNRKRHFALSRLLPYLSDEFNYFCLQTDIVAADQDTLVRTNISQYQGLLRDFSDTAALCSCMDLVISVDTSVAHLSCALGKPTWLLLAYAADWRWLLDREDSPWYASARLLRQPSDDAWESVFKRVAAEMRTIADPQS